MPPGPLKPRARTFTFVFMRMAGCGWCERFEPTWSDLKKMLRRQSAKIPLLLDSFERSDPALHRTGYLDHVKTFPTLLLRRPDGRVVVFEGERTVERIVAFLSRQGAWGLYSII